MIYGARTIPFIKASACGNDFLLIDASAVTSSSSLADITRNICDRHDGVGADGVEWIYPCQAADVEIRLINADGSDAEISGNGTRCVAAYICSTQSKEHISILTGAGMKICSLTGRKDSEYEFETEMGEAKVDPELRLTIGSHEVRGVPVSIGNPHYVVFVSEFPEGWQKEAAEIQKSSEFAAGVNVEYVSVQHMHDITVRFYERGAGETKSSGTGSCASAAAAMATGLANSPVKVSAAGGAQIVRKDKETIFLRGPARLICRGDFFTT